MTIKKMIVDFLEIPLETDLMDTIRNSAGERAQLNKWEAKLK